MAYVPMLEDITMRDEVEATSLIDKIFTKEQIKMLFYHACRIDIEDNNEKAEMIGEIIGSEFEELGTGTNRVAYRYTPGIDRDFRGGSGLVFEFALDRRGFVDNYTEFKRSFEQPERIVHVYETNMLISVQEYFYMIDEYMFRLNESVIKEDLLKPLSEVYIFEDIGYNMKNYANFGYRANGDLIIGDAGYLYPKKGQEKALTCPRCSGNIIYNSSYTGFLCSNHMCSCKLTFMDVRRQMNSDLEDIEDQMIMSLNEVEMPDFDALNEAILGGKVEKIKAERTEGGDIIIPKFKMSNKSFMSDPPEMKPLPSSIPDTIEPIQEEDIDSDDVIDLISEEDLVMLELMSYDDRCQKASEKLQSKLGLDEDSANSFARGIVDLNDQRHSDIPKNDDLIEDEPDNITMQEAPMYNLIDDIIDDFKSGRVGSSPDSEEDDVEELSSEELAKQVDELNKKFYR